MSAEESRPESRPLPFVGSDLPDSEFLALRDLLLERRGIDLARYKDACIKRRIATRVRALGFAEASSYLEVLRRDETEVDALMAALTIHVSQFFRNRSTFVELERRVLPDLFRQCTASGRRELRLWSVGCASGEEPYSLALLVEEAVPPGLSVDILGTDISPAVLEKAREARYDPLRLGELPEEVRERFFTAEGRDFRLRERIRRRVRFCEHDILCAPDYPAADLVLCRNVLIYFSRGEQERILTRMAQVLPRGGYLVLGRAETLTGEARRLFHARCPAERIYQRQ